MRPAEARTPFEINPAVYLATIYKKMVDQEYVSALVIWGKRSAANLVALQKQACDLYATIVAHMGGQLVSVAAPGQHVAYSRPMTVQEEFAAVNFALEQIAGRPAIIRTCYPVFW
jgi:hypothetical protein